MAEYFTAPTQQSLHNNVMSDPADVNEMYFNSNNIINRLSRHQSSNNRVRSNNIRESNHYQQIWYHNYGAVARENDVERRNRENITRNQNYYNNNNNSGEIIHNIDDEYQCFIHQAAAKFQNSGNSNDILTEHDYAEIATISRNFIPSHRIGGIDSFSALQHLASAAERLQQVDDKYDDDNNLDLMLDSPSDWDDINDYQEFNGDLDGNAIDR